jgi:hypothetical protein
MKHTEYEILNSIPLLNQYYLPEIKSILTEYLFGEKNRRNVIDELKKTRWIYNNVNIEPNGYIYNDKIYITRKKFNGKGIRIYRRIKITETNYKNYDNDAWLDDVGIIDFFKHRLSKKQINIHLEDIKYDMSDNDTVFHIEILKQLKEGIIKLIDTKINSC